MAGRSLVWVGGALARVRVFPAAVRREIGHQLYQVQVGWDPSDWKPMPSVGPGVVEVRVHEGAEYRVLYVAKFAEAVYVLHAFEKRTRQTRNADIELARRSLAAVVQHRKR